MLFLFHGRPAEVIRISVRRPIKNPGNYSKNIDIGNRTGKRAPSYVEPGKAGVSHAHNRPPDRVRLTRYT